MAKDDIMTQELSSRDLRALNVGRQLNAVRKRFFSDVQLSSENNIICTAAFETLIKCALAQLGFYFLEQVDDLS